MFEEWAKASREEIRQMFGETGIHEDCENYESLNGTPYCKVCIYDWRKRNRKESLLQCEAKVCYFYKPKRKDDKND